MINNQFLVAIFILSTGEPLPQASIAYSIGNATVESVDGTTLLEALVPGNTTVMGKAQAMNMCIHALRCAAIKWEW